MKKSLILILISSTLLCSVPNYKEFSERFIKVAELGNPAVVSIISEKEVGLNYHQFFFPGGNQFPEDSFKNHSLGSGVIINANKGYIITNNHVIDEADEIKVMLFDNREIDAEVVGTDPLSDLAVIKIDAKNLIQIPTGDSEKLSVGEWVVAIGSPFGLHLNHTVTAGIVSAIGRSDVISRMNFENFIQHDAAINPGNSGGALLNLEGELIGINTAIATDGFSKANAGVGFAIPINQVLRVTEDLIKEGKVTRGWLGVSIQDIDSQMAKVLEIKNRNGAIISQVFENSPADKDGVKAHDIIIEVNEVPINNASELKNVISSGRPNDKVKLKVIRDNKIKVLTVELSERPNQNDLISGNFNNSSKYDLIGLIVEDVESRVTIIEVKIGSESNHQNIRKGDIIAAVGRNPINSIIEYHKHLNSYKHGNMIMLRIIRNGNARYVAFEIN